MWAGRAQLLARSTVFLTTFASRAQVPKGWRGLISYR